MHLLHTQKHGTAVARVVPDRLEMRACHRPLPPIGLQAGHTSLVAFRWAVLLTNGLHAGTEEALKQLEVILRWRIKFL